MILSEEHARSMTSKDAVMEAVERELGIARAALAVGNHGKTRVCARRAVGNAISWMLSRFPRTGWHTDAMSRIASLSSDPTFSQGVRDAARRLSSRIDEHFRYDEASDPVSDALLIIQAIMTIMDAGDC